MAHPLISEIEALHENGETLLEVQERTDGQTVLVDSVGTSRAAMKIVDGRLMVHRYGEDISSDETRAFGGGSTARDVMNFALGYDPPESEIEEEDEEDEENEPPPGTPEERLRRLELVVEVLVDDNQKWNRFSAALADLLGLRPE
jgi:hypothetical protein